MEEKMWEEDGKPAGAFELEGSTPPAGSG